MTEAALYNPELIPDLLGPKGPLSRSVGAFEDRPYQREMSLEVARLLEEGGFLAIEAPTGIGKSLLRLTLQEGIENNIGIRQVIVKIGDTPTQVLIESGNVHIHDRLHNEAIQGIIEDMKRPIH